MKDKMKNENIILESIDSNTYKPKIFKDVQVTLLFEKKGYNEYSIGSVERDAYLKVSQAQLEHVWGCITLMEGSATIQEIEREMACRNIQIEVEQLVKKLLSIGLLEDENYTGKPFDEASRLTIPLCAVKISKLAKKIAPFSKGMVLCIFFLFVLSGLAFAGLVVFGRISVVELAKYKNSYFKGIILSSMLTVPIFITHEFAHVIFAARYKLYAGRMNFALYFGFIPMAYVRIPGIYTLTRLKRIEIMTAGIFWNITAGLTLAVLGSLLRTDVLKVIALANFQIAIVNLSPFSLSDGYFILCNLLKTSNLRMNFFKMLTQGKSPAAKSSNSVFARAYIVCTFIFMAIMSISLGNTLMRKILSSGLFSNMELSSGMLMIFHICISLVCIGLCFILIRVRFKVYSRIR